MEITLTKIEPGTTVRVLVHQRRQLLRLARQHLCRQQPRRFNNISRDIRILEKNITIRNPARKVKHSRLLRNTRHIPHLLENPHSLERRLIRTVWLDKNETHGGAEVAVARVTQLRDLGQGLENALADFAAGDCVVCQELRSDGLDVCGGGMGLVRDARYNAPGVPTAAADSPKVVCVAVLV